MTAPKNYGALQPNETSLVAWDPVNNRWQAVACDASGNLAVSGGSGGVGTSIQGDTAHDGVDAGNPVKIGGFASAVAPSAVSANGDRVNAWFGRNGNMIVGLGDSNGLNGSNSLTSDANVPGGLAIDVFSPVWTCNGTNFDRQRNNNEQTALASAARTVTINSADLTNFNSPGVVVTVDVTVAGTGSITVSLQYKDTLSGQYKTLLTSAAITTISTTTLVLFPGVTVAANLAASHPLPRIWRVNVVHNNANSITYSVSANYVGQ
jgi:hypothetical protein